MVGKDGEDLTRHDKWLCMMYPRMKLLHRLLSDDGVIFISIDDNEQSHLTLLCDQIFGRTNSIGPIIQNKMNSKNDTVNIQKNHEFILVYRKTKQIKKDSKVSPTIINTVYKTKPIQKEGDKFYFLNDYITTRGEGGILNARHNLGHTVYFNPKTNDKIAICDYDLELAKTSNNISEVYTTDKDMVANGYEIIRPPKVRGKLGCWTWSLDKINSQKEDLVVTGKKGSYGLKKRTFVNPNQVLEENGKYFIRIFDESNSRSIIDFSTNDGTKNLTEVMNEHGVFENPKNTNMLEYLIKLFPKKDSLILDSFAGSGSTAEAVLKLNKKDGGNRKFIMVELEDYADTITATRIKKVIKGYEFSGKQKETLKEYSINVTNLKKADRILKEYEDYKNDEQFSKVVLTENNGAISIVGEKMVSGKTEGIGGSFDFYELGQPIFKDNENLNEEVGEDKIRNYIYYTETKQPLTRPQSKDTKYLLDNYQDTGYYFYYEKDSLTTLDNNSLGIISELQEQYIIYADICLLDEQYMLNKNIIFKKIPRDIKRF